jgi:hypothetical protein
VWSTDWVRDRGGQINRVLAELEAARKPSVPNPSAPVPEPKSAPVPALRKAPKPPEPDFDSIEKVSDTELNESVIAPLIEFGSMPAEDLISAASKRLGFKRVGPKIRDRIATAINALTSAGKLSITDDNRVKVHHQQ